MGVWPLSQEDLLGWEGNGNPFHFPCQCMAFKRWGFDPWVRKIVWVEKGMATHSIFLANAWHLRDEDSIPGSGRSPGLRREWQPIPFSLPGKIPRTEEPMLQSTGSRVRHDWSNLTYTGKYILIKEPGRRNQYYIVLFRYNRNRTYSPCFF